jgi:hypothetical protein
MIYIFFVPPDIPDEESARLRDVLEEIEEFAGFRQRGEEEGETQCLPFRHPCPGRRNGDVLRMMQRAPVAWGVVDQESRAPDPDAAVFFCMVGTMDNDYALPADPGEGFIFKLCVNLHSGLFRDFNSLLFRYHIIPGGIPNGHDTKVNVKQTISNGYLKLFLLNLNNYPYLVKKSVILSFKRWMMKKNTLEYRMMQEHNRLKITDSRLLMGSIKDKFPIILDGGKTTIYISDKSRESEIREMYELRMSNKFTFLSRKGKS